MCSGQTRFSDSGQGRLFVSVWPKAVLSLVRWYRAEIASFFPSPNAAQDALSRLEVEFSPIELQTTLLASRVWKAYRSRGGQRERMVADFLIGAHAMSQTDRLLTRDRGFYRTYFSRLRVLDPSKV